MTRRSFKYIIIVKYLKQEKMMARDSFRSRRGFIIACIGSAVGMGNIWLFPARVSEFGGAGFLIP